MKLRTKAAFWAFVSLSIASIGTALAIPACPADSNGTSNTASCCWEGGAQSRCISESKDSHNHWKVLDNRVGSSCASDHTCY